MCFAICEGCERVLHESAFKLDRRSKRLFKVCEECRYRHRRAQKNASERRTKPLRRQRKKAACLRENLSELLSKYGYEPGALWVASDKEIIDASKHIRGV